MSRKPLRRALHAKHVRVLREKRKPGMEKSQAPPHRHIICMRCQEEGVQPDSEHILLLPIGNAVAARPRIPLRMNAEAMLSQAISMRAEQMEHEEQEVYSSDDEMQDYCTQWGRWTEVPPEMIAISGNRRGGAHPSNAALAEFMLHRHVLGT